MVEHKRVPNLEELDEEEAYTFLTDVFFYGPVPESEVVYQANHPRGLPNGDAPVRRSRPG